MNAPPPGSKNYLVLATRTAPARLKGRLTDRRPPGVRDSRNSLRSWFETIIDGCRNATGRFARGLARTLNQWREPILAWHRHVHTKGPVEGSDSLIKKVKCVDASFTNFDNYRIRTLLAVGGCNWDLLGTPPR